MTVAAPPDSRIEKFIRKHHVMTLTCAELTDDIPTPWSCHLFYAYISDCKLDEYPDLGAAFVFTSSDETRHARMMRKNPRVSATVVLESKIVGRLQGVQLAGRVIPAQSDPQLLGLAKKRYLKRFPYAAPMLKDEHLWIFQADYMKYTDNTLGFGTKLHWGVHL